MALIAFLLLAIPVVEIWAALAVAGQIGGPATLLALIALSCVGLWALKRQGIASWRSVSREISAGRSPGPQMLDGVVAMIGAGLLVVPGFATAVVGALLLLPPVRTLLRPVILAWMTKRVTNAAGRSRFNGIFVTSTVDGRGGVHTQATTFGDVIDAEGWDIVPGEPGSTPMLPGPVGSSRFGRDGAIDTDGRPRPDR